MVECQNCEIEDALVKCNDCSLNLCDDCDSDLHEYGSKKNHKRIPLNPNNNLDDDDPENSIAYSDVSSVRSTPPPVVIKKKPVVNKPKPKKIIKKDRIIDKVITCENCESEDAIEDCSECELMLCSACTSDFHSFGKAKEHQRTKLILKKKPLLKTPIFKNLK